LAGRYSVFLATFVELAVFSPLYVFGTSVKNYVDMAMWTYIWVFSSTGLHIFISFVPVPCCFYCYGSVVQFKARYCFTCRKLKLDPCLSSCTSINSKWIEDLNIRPETLKSAQKRAGNKLEAIGIGDDFLSRTQVAQQLRERMDKWDYMKLKSFCTTKEMICLNTNTRTGC
jgi:hypothetical protein